MSARPPLSRGDVVLIPFPFTELSGKKVRPAVIVARPSGDDLIVAFITSQTARGNSQIEHVLHPRDPEFGLSGLKVASRIVWGKLATLDQRIIRRRLGRIGPQTEQAIAQCLRHLFSL